MKKIKNNKEIYGGKIKYFTSKMINVSLAMGVADNVISSIFNIINTNAYLNNENPQYNLNPYYSQKSSIRFGSDQRHSAISYF